LNNTHKLKAAQKDPAPVHIEGTPREKPGTQLRVASEQPTKGREKPLPRGEGHSQCRWGRGEVKQTFGMTGRQCLSVREGGNSEKGRKRKKQRKLEKTPSDQKARR